VQAFCVWPEDQGWSTEIEAEYLDVVARRGSYALILLPERGARHIAVLGLMRESVS
jgi:hypothetical protein